MKPRMSLIALLGLFTACGENAATDLERYSSQLDQSIDSLHSDVAAHGHTVMAATDVGRIHALEQTYRPLMSAHMSDIRGAEQGMMSCASCTNSRDDGPRAVCDDASTMEPTVERANDELTDHWQAMQSLANVSAAHTEEERHTAAMTNIIGAMHEANSDIMDAMQAMTDRGMSMMCASHMH